jgi:hypothetical protein
MVLLLAGALYNTIEFPQYVNRLQHFPDWMSSSVRHQLTQSLQDGTNVITHARSSLPRTWFWSRHLLPQDWAEVRELAAAAPQPAGCDLVGVGQAGAVLADAIASQWEGPPPAVSYLQAPLLPSVRVPVKGRRVLLVDGFGLNLADAEERLQQAGNVILERVTWKSMVRSPPTVSLAPVHKMLFPFM